MYTIWIERKYPLRLVCRYHGYHQLSYIRLWLMNWWNLLWWTIDIGIVSNKIKLRLNRWSSGRILVTTPSGKRRPGDADIHVVPFHYSDVILGTVASQITSLTIVYSTVDSDADKNKTSKLRVTGLCVGNSPGTGEFPAQMASNAENVSIWWRHHVMVVTKVVNLTDVNS